MLHRTIVAPTTSDPHAPDDVTVTAHFHPFRKLKKKIYSSSSHSRGGRAVAQLGVWGF